MLQAGVTKRCRFSFSPSFKARPSNVDAAPMEIELNFQHLIYCNAPEVRPGETRIHLQAHYGLTCTREVVNSGKQLNRFKLLFASASNIVHSNKILIQGNADNKTDCARDSKLVKLPVTDSSGTVEYIWDGSKVVAIEKEGEQSIKGSCKYKITNPDAQDVMDKKILDGIRWKTVRCIHGVRCAFFPNQNDVTPGKFQMSRLYL